MPKYRFLLAISLLFAVALPEAPAQAGANLVTNGDFETLTNGNGEVVPGSTTGTYITSATGWYSTSTAGNSGYPFLFFTSNAVTTGFNDAWDNGVRYLYGATNGGQNGNAWTGTSAAGGNYLVADGDYHATAISQAVTGLVAGQTYALSFYWAAAQFVGFSGNTTETWIATLGSQSRSTTTYSLPSQGFSGWMTATLNFTYDGSSNVLSFLASGTPSGQPPMLLLDGVSLTAIPEPPSLAASLAAGLGALAALVLARRRRPSGNALHLK